MSLKQWREMPMSRNINCEKRLAIFDRLMVYGRPIEQLGSTSNRTMYIAYMIITDRRAT